MCCKLRSMHLLKQATGNCYVRKVIVYAANNRCEGFYAMKSRKQALNCFVENYKVICVYTIDRT